MLKFIGADKIKRTAKLVWHIGLIATAIVFALDGFNDYLEGNTYFKEKTENLTNADLPTVTICFATLAGRNCPVIEFGRLQLNIAEYGKTFQIRSWKAGKKLV